MSRIWRRPAYLLLALTVLAYAGAAPFAAPCPDILDGPCEENWASGVLFAALMVALVAIPYALLQVARDLRARRTRRRTD